MRHLWVIEEKEPGREWEVAQCWMVQDMVSLTRERGRLELEKARRLDASDFKYRLTKYVPEEKN